MFHKIKIFMQSSSLNFFKICFFRKILQSPDIFHLSDFNTFHRIQLAKNMYVLEYHITVLEMAKALLPYISTRLVCIFHAILIILSDIH